MSEYNCLFNVQGKLQCNIVNVAPMKKVCRKCFKEFPEYTNMCIVPGETPSFYCEHMADEICREQNFYSCGPPPRRFQPLKK